MTEGIPCKNPQHPDNHSRFTMIKIKDTPTDEAFACKACLDVHKVYSVQVRTKPEFKRHVRGQLAREGKLAPKPQTAPMPNFHK
jgi:hypothetical protein